MPSPSPHPLLRRAPLALLLALAPLLASALPSCGKTKVCGDARRDTYTDAEKASDATLVDEECDDGNLIDTDDCTSECKKPACGDGFVQATNDEECDLATGNADTGKCTAKCTLNVCGDGAPLEGVEECDDGNLSNTDDCLETCLLATCGDGVLHITTTSDQPLEECDDGNDGNDDNCTTLCTKPACGDGFVQNGEDCDDGNEDDDDACPSTCLNPSCGDGFIDEPAEECDDGNLIETDACRNDCKAAQCGDGVLQDGVEECDDGNLVAGDFCSPICKKECFGDSAELYDGRCYQYFPGPLAWGDANCNAFGSHLVTIESNAENEFVKGLLPNSATDAWIGLTDQVVESVWVWQLDQEGDVILFPALQKWAGGQPDDDPAPGADCAILAKASGLWLDEDCTETRGFVCEHEFPQ